MSSISSLCSLATNATAVISLTVDPQKTFYQTMSALCTNMNTLIHFYAVVCRKYQPFCRGLWEDPMSIPKAGASCYFLAVFLLVPFWYSTGDKVGTCQQVCAGHRDVQSGRRCHQRCFLSSSRCSRQYPGRGLRGLEEGMRYCFLGSHR